MKIKSIILCSILVLACNLVDSTDNKILDAGFFEIETPSNWKYKKLRGIDSQIGVIKGANFKLDFDWSEMGYANRLVQTHDEFLQIQKSNWLPGPIPYGETGVTYVLKESVERTRNELIEKYGIEDTIRTKVEELQIPTNEIEILNDEYYLISKYIDTTTRIKFEIPKEINDHIILIDTMGQYIRKTVYPKKNDKGTTGIYFEDLKSDFNFNLVAYNLNKENRNKALEVFKTIKLKR